MTILRRVVITGLGVVSPIGDDPSRFMRALLEGRSGIGLLSPELTDGLQGIVGAQANFDASRHFPTPHAAQLDRGSQMALVAAAQATRDAGLDDADTQRDRIGVYWGTGMGGATTLDDAYWRLYAKGQGAVRPLTIMMAMNHAPAAQISIAHRFTGPLLTFSSACASSAHALGEALRAIRLGVADAVVAGGSEALLAPGALRAWDALRTLAVPDREDPARSCKPFARDRTGLVLGEGAAALVLEADSLARARGVHIYAELVGYGACADSTHLSRPDSAGQARAMRLALEDAGLDPQDVGYINAHGTATRVGDIAETEAIKAVFGEHAHRLPVSSTKSMHGHLMGAAGALELIVAVLALELRALPPTAHLQEADPACDLDYVPNVARRDVAANAVMSNSFAFGGANAALVARSYS